MALMIPGPQAAIECASFALAFAQPCPFSCVPRFSRMLRLITAVCLLLAVPVLGILGSWLALDAQAVALLRHQFSTVLPEYAWSSLLLSVSVALGVAVMGGATAAAVSLFDFPGR